MGKPMNLTTMEQEAYDMATLDRIHNDVVFNGEKMTPILFSMLLNMVNIRDEKFAHLLKIEKQFGRDWTQNLKESAEMQRVRVWPLTAGAGD